MVNSAHLDIIANRFVSKLDVLFAELLFELLQADFFKLRTLF